MTFDRETEFAQTNSDLDADVYTAIGACEDDVGRRREGANLPDEFHISVAMVVLSRGFRHHFATSRT